jgi:mono/diheme cytochrome c family protein
LFVDEGAMENLILMVVGIVLSSLIGFSANAQDQRQLVARGKYLVNGPALCANCHTPRGADLRPVMSKFLSGGEKFTSPVFVTYSRNITPDKDTGIGTWSDAQIIRAMREGFTKEGKTLGPPMPFEMLNKMSDDDARAIVAYLRTAKPMHNEVPEPKYKIPLEPQRPAKGDPAPSKSDKVAYGGYLVTMAHCLECHTPQVGPARDYERQLGAGGFSFEYAGTIVRSRNITSDKETGIGNMTDAQIKRAITQGIDREGKQLIPLMPYLFLKNLTAEDLDAVVAFVRTLPPVRRKNEPNPPLQSLLKLTSAGR